MRGIFSARTVFGGTPRNFDRLASVKSCGVTATETLVERLGVVVFILRHEGLCGVPSLTIPQTVFRVAALDTESPPLEEFQHVRQMVAGGPAADLYLGDWQRSDSFCGKAEAQRQRFGGYELGDLRVRRGRLVTLGVHRARYTRRVN